METYWQLVSLFPYSIFLALIFLRQWTLFLSGLAVAGSIWIIHQTTSGLEIAQRPDGSPESGFPSGHVAVTSFLLLSLADCHTIWIYSFLILIEMIARVQLDRHTWTQVVGGLIYGGLLAWLYRSVSNK